MIVLNPFQRRRYTLRTLLSPEEASRRLLDAMNDYNATARERFLMATAFGERFSAKIEPGTLGSSGSGTFLKHFVVEANGLFRPTRDGAIDLTIGFRRSTSLGQVLIRLGLICIIAMSVAILIAAPRIVPILAVSFGVGIAPLFLLWSLVAFAQGMRQANRDWEVLMRFVSTALASHHTERA